jgi:hypothetical protein
MSRFWLFFFLIFSSLSVWSQKTASFNSASSPFAKSKLYVYAIDNSITQNLKLVSETTCNEQGGFEISVPTDRAQKFQVAVNNAICSFYLSPDESYEIKFLCKDTSQTSIGLFQPWLIELTEKNGKTNLNSLIATFDSDLESFIDTTYFEFLKASTVGNLSVKKRINENSIHFAGKLIENDSLMKGANLGNFIQKISDFSVQMNTKFQKYYSGFPSIEHHIKCSILSISPQKNNSKLEEQIEPHIDNLAYGFSSLMDIWSKQLLEDIKSDPTRMYQTENIIISYPYFQTIYPFIFNTEEKESEMKAIRLINMLRLAYFEKAFHRPSIISLLENISTTSVHTRVVNLALASLRELNADLKNKQIPNLVAIDLRNKPWELQKNIDKHTYLYFFDNSTQTKKEIALLNSIQEKYSGGIEIFICYIGSDEIFLNEIATVYGSDLKILKTPLDFDLCNQFQLVSLPYAIQTNSKGQVMYSYTFLPSEKLIREWNSIMRKL